jgi:hypothetical protein
VRSAAPASPSSKTMSAARQLHSVVRQHLAARRRSGQQRPLRCWSQPDLDECAFGNLAAIRAPLANFDVGYDLWLETSALHSYRVGSRAATLSLSEATAPRNHFQLFHIVAAGRSNTGVADLLPRLVIHDVNLQSSRRGTEDVADDMIAATGFYQQADHDPRDPSHRVLSAPHRIRHRHMLLCNRSQPITGFDLSAAPAHTDRLPNTADQLRSATQ